MAELTIPLANVEAEAVSVPRAPKSRTPLLRPDGADPAAIANLEALPRPKRPPGRL